MGQVRGIGASGGRVGLVLGAGGVVGAAWMTGALQAVQDRLPMAINDVDLIVGTSAGSVRLVPGAQLDTTEDAGWAVWLPGGTRLLAGALDFSYAVDANTRAVRPFFFFPGGADHDIMDTPDLNFSSVLLPGRR